jgi:bifunctional non-homologous end joining protein LigD
LSAHGRHYAASKAGAAGGPAPSSMADKIITVEGRRLEISHAAKVLFPAAGITKADLVDYYVRVAEVMLPHVLRRPISMERYPDGITGDHFFQKETPGYFPAWVPRVSVRVREEGTDQPQLSCDDAATLAYVAAQACITPHIWLSRAPRLDHPDKLIFDLDPPDDDFAVVREAARAVRKVLRDAGLEAFPMSTGSRGLHVAVPLDGEDDFDAARDFARRLAEETARREPGRFTTETRKEDRRGRLFLDYLRNAYAQTSVAPYAVRARPGAPVAAPLSWDELGDRSLDSRTFNVGNIFRRLGRKADPWAKFFARPQSLSRARRRLDELLRAEKD